LDFCPSYSLTYIKKIQLRNTRSCFRLRNMKAVLYSWFPLQWWRFITEADELNWVSNESLVHSHITQGSGKRNPGGTAGRARSVQKQNRVPRLRNAAFLRLKRGVRWTTWGPPSHHHPHGLCKLFLSVYSKPGVQGTGRARFPPRWNSHWGDR
jgi:hypothetical protein